MKKIFKTKIILITMFAVFYLSSCLLESEFPLSDVDKGYNDKRLNGLWKFTNLEDDSEGGYVLILKTDDNIYHFIIFDKNYSIKSDGLYNGFVTKIGNESYLNVKVLNNSLKSYGNTKDNRYFFLGYKIEGGMLKMGLFDNNYVSEAIKDNKIKGEVDKVGNFETPILTDSTKNLYVFVKNADKNRLITSYNLVLEKNNL